MLGREINDCGVFSDEIIIEIVKVDGFFWYSFSFWWCLNRGLFKYFNGYVIQEIEILYLKMKQMMVKIFLSFEVF